MRTATQSPQKKPRKSTLQIPQNNVSNQNKTQYNNRVQTRENNQWETVKVLSLAGKATGKYSNCWNTKNHNNFKQPIDFSPKLQNGAWMKKH